MRRRQRILLKLGTIGTIVIFVFLLINNALSPAKQNEVRIRPEAYHAKHVVDIHPADDENEIEKAQENRIAELEPTAEMIDWHDHDAITRDLNREGLGEQGKKAYLENHDRDREKLMYRQNGFNAMLSDMISVNRSVYDLRYKG